jgi:hypothetical protein
MPDAYDSCHEAGHGVFRVLNGDIVEAIVIHQRGQLPAEALPAERGVTNYHFKPMECECKGYVRSQGKDLPDLISFGKGCQQCKNYVTNMVAGMFAGEEATKLLMPAEHRAYDSQLDSENIDSVFRLYAVSAPEREAIEAEARRRAAAVIEREEAAVRALQAIITQASTGRVERQEIEAVIARTRAKPDSGMRLIPGKMRVLTIDLSGNALDFEYELTRQLHSFLAANGIEVAHPEPLLLNTLDDFGAVAEKNYDFNTLLLVTHGKPDTKGRSPSQVQITRELPTDDKKDVFANWYELAALAPPLAEKLLCMVVCHGMCGDMTEALVKDGHFAKVAVAPITDLKYWEALLFFQNFFRTVNASSQDSIDPDVVLDALNTHNPKINDKMRAYSQVLRQGLDEYEVEL